MSGETPGPDATLAEVQAWLRERIRDGATCPACTQFAKVYRRKITGRVAAMLIRAYRDYRRTRFHAPTLAGIVAGDFAKLRFWKLIEEDQPTGWWRVTPTGEDFLHGRARVASHAEIYDNALLALNGPPVGVRDVLGTRFDYDELMRPGTVSPWEGTA